MSGQSTGEGKRARRAARRARKAARASERDEAEELLHATDGGDGLLVSLVLLFVYLGALASLPDLWGAPRRAVLEFLQGFMVPGDAPVLLMAVGGFGGIFALVPLLSDAGARARGRLRKASVQGELLSSEIVSVPNPGGSTGMKTERHVRFAYTVDGERHEARVIYRLFTAMRGPRFGAPFMVYYQPGWPKNAGLLPAWRERAYGATLALAVCGALFVAGALALVAAP